MIDWTAIDTVLLDMDGTLLDLHFDNFFWLEHLPQRYARIHDRDEDAARHELVERFRAAQGSLDWYCVDHWSRELGLDVAALKQEVRHLIAVRPHVEDFLARLHASQRRVLLVTNAHRKSLSLKLAHTGLERWFDAIVSSHDFRLAKEEPGFWAALAAVEPFDPVRTLLIDDNHAVLQSAHDYGIRYLLTLLQPDSRREARSGLHFPAILHFDEIMPELERIDGR
ncbi:MAG: GMP/IMP nucleotidase YrfG [Pseudomonadales bacterium]|nr:GMP/IMP nucleotidase YrfG [Pseudomonadales bacterium]